MPTDVSDNFPRAAGTASAPSAHVDAAAEVRERLARHGTVQLIGQPATMTQEAFRELVAAHGGEFRIGSPGERSAIFVVGQREWPLMKDGRLPNRLRALIARGRRERVWSLVLPEEQFLAAIGKAEY